MKYLQTFLDRHGRWRIYLRRPGFKPRALPTPKGYQGPDKPLPPDCLEFLAAYQEAMTEDKKDEDGGNHSAHGTIAWLVGEFFDSLDFRARSESVRARHRRHCEALRVKHGAKRVSGLESHHFENRIAEMMETPAAANAYRMAMRDLMGYAVKRKLIAANPLADIKKLQLKNVDGHWTWTLDEVAQFRAAHPIGSQPRLALELMTRLALRRSDAIRLGPSNLQGGVLKYTQHKNRERKAIKVEVPLPADLLDVIRKTRPTGIKTWLVNLSGTPFTEDPFNVWFREQIKAAGLDERCTPHGLRKRCLTDLANRGATAHEIMSISGHLTLSEVERYTRGVDRAHNAKEAMRKGARKRA